MTFYADNLIENIYSWAPGINMFSFNFRQWGSSLRARLIQSSGSVAKRVLIDFS